MTSRADPTGTLDGFEPPAYPYDRLTELHRLASAHEGGAVDLSVGTPCDPPPQVALDALRESGTERGYPSSAGKERLLGAARGWIRRRFGVEVPEGGLAACVGTKEFVATLPSWLCLMRPGRDTVLYPAVSYPTYAMGAELAGCRALPVAVDAEGRLALEALAPADVDRALLLWVNSPSNPTGALDDLAGAAAWGRSHSIPVFSDECYSEFTWAGKPRTVLEEGTAGVVAVHSLSKRSNMAGLRVGFYAGDPDLVGYLADVRRHLGMMVAGPVQDAAAAALDDDEHVSVQRQRYRERLDAFVDVMLRAGIPVVAPQGGFYLWAGAGEAGDSAWVLAEGLASRGGAVVSPGDLFGAADHVRVAMVQPLERLELVDQRLARSQ